MILHHVTARLTVTFEASYDVKGGTLEEAKNSAEQQLIATMQGAKRISRTVETAHASSETTPDPEPPPAAPATT